MKKRSPFVGTLLLMFAGLFLSSAPVIAQNPSLQVFEEWTSAGGYITFYQKNRTITDASGNVYVTGTTLNVFGNYDILTAKYSSSGSLLWQQIYAGSGGGNDGGADIATDAAANVYITGSYYKNSTDSNNAITIKYDSTGVQQWMKEYNGAGSRQDGTVKIQISGLFVYVVGSTYSGTTDQYDFLAIKYDILLGNQSWVSVWDNAGLLDGGVKLQVKNALVTVAGGSQVNSTQYKYAVVNFDILTGLVINSFTTGGNQPIALDQVNDLAVDNSGNIYITGGVQNTGSGYDIRTVKLNQSNLSVAWTATYNGSSSLDDKGNAIALDASGNVYITGFETVTGQGKNYVTIKYSSSGSTTWTKVYNDPSNGNDEAVAIGIQGSSRIYVTGSAFNGSNLDYYTISYEISSGNLLWEIGFNALANKDDRAADLAVIGSNELVVTGTAYENPFGAKYITVKYVERNVMMPQDTVAITSSACVFTRNNGQLMGTDSAHHPEVKFYTMHHSPQVFFQDTCVSYSFIHIDTANSANDSLARVDMKFVGANSDLKIRPMDERDEINNFYCPEFGSSYERVMDYSKLICFNVWNNVDMIYGSNLNGLKYYFICKPVGGGASYTSIHLKFEGADSVKIDGSGNLIIYTKYGQILQPKAAAWELDGSGNYSGLGWQPSYQIVGTNEVKFTGIGSYNPAHVLVIAVDRGNPTFQSTTHLDWSTYFGGNDNDYLTKIDVDQSSGDFLLAGETYSTNFPVTNASTVPFSGGIDAIAARFTSGGVRIFCTYYGTSSNVLSVQRCQAGAIGSNGHYYIAGNSDYQNVSIRFPVAQPPGAYADQTFNGGNQDAFIAEFDNGSGALVWATYYGGSGTSNEFIRDMDFDAAGNLYCVMNADSLTPTTTLGGAYNSTSNLGGMILKFDSNRQIKWATNFGTTIGTATCLALNGNVLYVGGSCGAGLPIRNPGFGAYVDSTLTGTSDGYIARFDAADSLIWCTYFGGNLADYPTSMSATLSDLLVGGLTSSNDSFPWYYPGGTAYIDSVYGGQTDAFFARFKNDGYLLWSTYFGGSDKEINFTRVTEDQQGNPYFMGQTSSSDLDYRMTPFAYADSIIGDASFADEYFATFDQFNAIKWATYFGGQHSDGGPNAFGLGTYNDSLIFFCGSTWTPPSDNPPFPLQNLTGSYYYFLWPGGFTSGHVGRFTVSPALFVGINEPVYNNNTGGSLYVYPNPSDGQFTVTINSQAKEKKLEVYNSIGQLIETQELMDNQTTQTISLNLSEKPTGVYFIVLREDGSVVTKKIIKQ